jgi:hypothetical protein
VQAREGIASAHVLHVGVEELSHIERKRSVQSVQSLQGAVHNFALVGGKSFSSMQRLVRKQTHYPVSDRQFIMFPVSRSKANESF